MYDFVKRALSAGQHSVRMCRHTGLFASGLTMTPLIHLEGRGVNVDQLLEAGQILQEEGILLYYCKDLLLCLHLFLLLHFTLLRFLDIFSALISHYFLRLKMMFLTIYKSDILLFYGNDHQHYQITLSILTENTTIFTPNEFISIKAISATFLKPFLLSLGQTHPFHPLEPE